MGILNNLAKPVVKQLHQFHHQRTYARSRTFVLRRFPRHSVGAEIGVWKGEFTAQILRVVEPKRLHLIDPWEYQSVPEFSRSFYGGTLGESQEAMDRIHSSVVEKFGQYIRSGIVDIKRGPSDRMANEFPPNYFDWLYVDGDHRYEGALKDLELYHPKLKANAIMAGDDYAEDTGQWWGDGVMRAVAAVVKRGLYRDLVVNYNQFMLVKARP